MDDYDLIATLGQALREAHHAGEVERERTLYATLAQELHSIGLSIDPNGEALGAIVRSNGYIAPIMLAKLGIRAG